ncbi:MAG TPA: ABC transporter substrate-binding protein [Stellaceae bacterium]|jgi:NitT/TauT family transport system substrate-binding protein|nr:ABC transporter substrate-binding protein [Stellaceae bacterium]
MKVVAGIVGSLCLLLGFTPLTQAADLIPIKIGVVQTLAVGPIFVADERGYFRDEGLDAQITFFDAAQPISVAVASGDVDFGCTGMAAAFYSLAGQGVLRIIGAGNREMPGFKNAGYIASNRAYDAGFTSLKQLAGKTVAVTQVGSQLHYDIGLAADKYKIPLKDIRVAAVQTNTNMSSALAGGQADLGVFPVTPAMTLLSKNEAHLLGWVGDEVPYSQANTAFTSTKIANGKRDTVERFLRAFKRGAKDYHDAFADDQEHRRDGPTAEAIIAILAKYTKQKADTIDTAIPWLDAQLRLDAKDVRHQIEWFTEQGQMKGKVNAADIIDKRYVVPLPGRE